MPDNILEIDRLNPNSNLSNPNSDGYKLFDNTLVWYLRNIDDEDELSNMFVALAEGVWLDLIGYIKGIFRFVGESDDDFRERIIFSDNFQLCKEDIEALNGIIICYVRDLNNQVSSKNVLLSDEYIIEIDDNLKSYIDRYINNGTWHFLKP